MSKKAFNSPELTIVRELVLHMQRRFTHWQRNTENGSARELVDRLLAECELMTPEGLEVALKTRSYRSSGECIFLEPIERENWSLPVLTIAHEFENSRQELRFQVGLFQILDDGKVVGIGFRFESPEGVGLHNYYHAQLFSAYAGSGPRLSGCPDWIPVSHPALALDARNSATLLVCMLVSLYGRTFFEKNIGLSAKVRHFIRRDIKKMHCLS
jgi:hypothetical protein